MHLTLSASSKTDGRQEKKLGKEEERLLSLSPLSLLLSLFVCLCLSLSLSLSLVSCPRMKMYSLSGEITMIYPSHPSIE